MVESTPTHLPVYGLQISFLLEHFSTFTLQSLDIFNIIHYFKLPQPDHLKIDVDGAELEILEGSRKTLKKLKSVLIEIEEENEKKRKKIKKILKDNNFKLKFQSKNELVFNKTHNEIWVKNNH